MAKTFIRCEALECDNTNRNCKLTFFKFPSNDPSQLNKWCNNIEMKISSKISRFICSEHFDLRTFTNSLRRRLHRWAIPTIQIPGKEQKTVLYACLPGVDKCSASNLPIGTVEKEPAYGVNTPSSHQVDDPYCLEEALIHDKVEVAAIQEKEESTCFQLTPKTRKLMKFKTSLYRMKKRLFFHNTSPNGFSKKTVLDMLSKKLKTPLFNIVAAQIKNSVIPAKGRRWMAHDKAFAFNIYLRSPTAYNVLRKFMYLPTIRTLRRSIAGVDCSTGINKAVLKVLQQKVAKMNEPEKICILVFDEMAIRPGLQYLHGKDKVVGFADINDQSEKPQVATHAMVFMIRGLKTNWKQVLGHYLVYRCMPGSVLKMKVVECIDMLQNVGLDVKAIACDQGSNNQRLFSKLGFKTTKTSFQVNDEEVYFFYDTPHLLKSLRNNLMKYNVQFGDKVATWKYIYDFHAIDSRLQFRTVPKLTKIHVEPLVKAKMKVRYAAQALSSSVASAICLLTSLGYFPAKASQTADFTQKVDSLFDSLNTRTKTAKKELLCAVTMESNHMAFWKEMVNFVSSWEFIDTNGKKIYTHCKKGWLITLNSTLNLIPELLKQQDFVLTRRLNQDPIENAFSVVRSKRGNDSNPDCVHLMTCLRAIMVNNFFQASKEGNCEEDLDEVLLAVKGTSSSNDTEVTASFFATKQANCSAPHSNSNLPEDILQCYEDNIFYYIAGYAAKEALEKVNQCEDCKNVLLSLPETACVEPQSLLTQFKNYSEVKNSLNYPSSQFYSFFSKMTDVNLQALLLSNSALHNMAKAVKEETSFDVQLHNEHRETVHNFVVLLYCKLFLFSYIKKINREIRTTR